MNGVKEDREWISIILPERQMSGLKFSPKISFETDEVYKAGVLQTEDGSQFHELCAGVGGAERLNRLLVTQTSSRECNGRLLLARFSSLIQQVSLVTDETFMVSDEPARGLILKLFIRILHFLHSDVRIYFRRTSSLGACSQHITWCRWNRWGLTVRETTDISWII